ncbi:MAG: polyprenyl synthetase family protein [Holosporales bacterium]|jgi:octaprenyl-diphosphate synthase|nr:polyprenyl synthetase family protein [Holosporales bacterium]
MFSEIIDAILEKKRLFDYDLKTLEMHIANFISNDNLKTTAPFILKKGKRLRATLYFNFWRGNNKISDEIKYKTIALIEIIHFASMLHDDVVDNNFMRREEASFMKKYGGKISIILGDFIIILAIKEFRKLHNDNPIVRNLFLRECSATAYGAFLEQQLNINSTFAQYVRSASLKTGSLFKLPCFLANYLSTGNFPSAKKIAIWGLCIGIIFQAQNDFNCYKFTRFEDSEDYVQKNITLPIIILRDYFDFDLKKFELQNQSNYDEIKDLIFSKKFKRIVESLLNKYLTVIHKFRTPRRMI